MSERATVKKWFAFSAVPDALMEDKRLSLDARAVAGWMLGRPGNWEIRIEHMRGVLGVSEKAWKRIKKELAEGGYYQQTRGRGESVKGKKGTWQWSNVITDEPLFSLSPSPPKSTHAERVDAERTHARGGDKAEQVNRQVNTSLSGARGAEGEVEDLFDKRGWNSRDAERLAAAVKTFGDEAVRTAALAMAGGTHRPFVSELVARLKEVNGHSIPTPTGRRGGGRQRESGWDYLERLAKGGGEEVDGEVLP